jgi:hypothetical protein
MKNKPLLWGGGAVLVALLILYVAFLSPAFNNEDLTGAIGAAKQHRAVQITEDDVALQDADIQDLLQSEFFYKLCTDAEFRRIAVEQFARLDVAAGRCAQFTSAASLGEMKVFLDLVTSNHELRMALAEGRMNVVNDVLAAENRLELLDVANRIYLTQSRHPQLNLATYEDMKVLIYQWWRDSLPRQAIIDGRLDQIHAHLASNKQEHLFTAAQKIFIAESRRPQLNLTSIAEMKVMLHLALGNAELRTALASGRQDAVREVLQRENRLELLDVAFRLQQIEGRTQFDLPALTDMKLVLDLAIADRDLRMALADGRIERVNDILTKDGKVALHDAAQRIYQADRKHPQIANLSLSNMKAFLDLTATSADLRNALASGRMNLVNDVLVASNRMDLLDVANRVYLTQGRHPQLNLSAYQDMKLFLEHALGNTDLRMALAAGRIDQIDAALIRDGRVDLSLAANRVYLAENRRPQMMMDLGIGNMRAILNLAQENNDFRVAIQENRLDAAARIALTADKHDISLRHLQMASYVLGDQRNFVAELGRMIAIVDSPAFRMAVDSPGWGRMVANADAVAWKQTVDAVKDGKMTIHRQ